MGLWALASVACLPVRSAAEPARAAIGPIEVLAYHRHYDRQHDAKWPDPFDTPAAACAARDADAIVVSVQTKLLWIDGNTGARLREGAPPFVTEECALATAQTGRGSVIVYAGSEPVALGPLGQPPPARAAVAHSPESNLTLSVLTRHSQPLWVSRVRSTAPGSAIDLAVAGRTAYVSRGDARSHEPVRGFDIESFTEGRSYEVAGCTGLFDDGRSVFAIDDHWAAWRLEPGAPPAATARPGTSLLMDGCSDMRGPLPVALGDGLSAAIDYDRAGAGCDEKEGINLRDDSGRVVARRPLPEGSWRFSSVVIPWDDGLRVIAQRTDRAGFQVWRVTIARGTSDRALPRAR